MLKLSSSEDQRPCITDVSTEFCQIEWAVTMFTTRFEQGDLSEIKTGHRERKICH